MNFVLLPELHWKHGYAIFWLLCIAETAGLLYWFKRKGWLTTRT
jgi:magnesium transporter